LIGRTAFILNVEVFLLLRHSADTQVGRLDHHGSCREAWQVLVIFLLLLNSEYVADVLDISDLTSGIFDDEINKGGASPINILQKQIQDFEINISEMERLIDDEYELQGEFPKYLPRVSSKKSSGSLLT
jgi:hypothetical protein